MSLTTRQHLRGREREGAPSHTVRSTWSVEVHIPRDAVARVWAPANLMPHQSHGATEGAVVRRISRFSRIDGHRARTLSLPGQLNPEVAAIGRGRVHLDRRRGTARMVAIPDRRRHLPRRKAGIEGASVSLRGSGKAHRGGKSQGDGNSGLLELHHHGKSHPLVGKISSRAADPRERVAFQSWYPLLKLCFRRLSLPILRYSRMFGTSLPAVHGNVGARHQFAIGGLLANKPIRTRADALPRRLGEPLALERGRTYKRSPSIHNSIQAHDKRAARRAACRHLDADVIAIEVQFRKRVSSV